MTALSTATAAQVPRGPGSGLALRQRAGPTPPLPLVFLLAVGCSQGTAQTGGPPPAPEVGVVTVQV